MLHGLYMSTAGALVEEVRQDVIANNLANVNTAAYKSGTAIFRERLDEARENTHLDHRPHPVLDRLGGGVFLDEVHYSIEDGPLEPSGNPFDVALQGEGYFAVSRGGATFYSRDGRFQRAADGTLTTGSGRFALLDERGRPLRIPEGEVVFGGGGEVLVGGESVGRLRIVGGAAPGHFERIGDTLFRFTGEGEPEPAPAVVHQHFVERSDVNPIGEMVRLIQSQRAYETNMRMVRIQDSTLERAVNQLGQVQA